MPSLEIKEPVLTIDRLGGDIVFDAQRLQELLIDTSIPSLGKRAIQKINKNKKNHNTYVDKYDYKEGEIGRVYSEFQQLPKEYRNYLLGDDCIEIDFQNCHYVLISQIADKYGVKYYNIKYYIENREECLKSIHTDRNIAKEIYLKAQYGGKIEEVCNDNINGIVEEIKNIITMLNADEKLTPIKKYAKKQLNKKNNPYKSLEHSFLSYVLQTIENRNVIALYDYLKQNEVEIKLINHDGIIIKKNDFDYEKFKGDMETHIFDTTDFYNIIDFKPCEQIYKPNEKKYILVSCEREVCDYLFKNHKNDIKRGTDGFYVKNKDEKHYTKGEEGLRMKIKNLEFKKETSSGSIVPYSSTTKGMEDIIKYLNKNVNDLFPIDEKFIEKVNIYTRGKVFFQDKYYDVNEKKFCSIKDDELPIIYIDRPAPDFSSITENMMNDYKKQFLDMFNDTQLKNVLNMTCRALFGNLDKNWTILSGLRNSGKGVFQKQVEHSFGDYCCSMELPMSKTQNNGDASQYREVLTSQAHLKRLCFTNEAQTLEGKKLKIDGNTIKKFISGGDPVKCRGLYKDSVDVVFNAHLFVNVNSIPESDPADAMMTSLPIKMPYKYVDEPTDMCEKMTDTDIKQKIINTNKDIFTKIVFNSFVSKEINVKDLCEDDRGEYNDNIMENTTEAPYIFKTKLEKGNSNDWISSDELRKIFKPCGMNEVSLGKFLSARMKFLEKNERVEGQKDKNGKQKYRKIKGYTGYKKIKNNNYNDDDDECENDDYEE
jgi:hypothetical protein